MLDLLAVVGHITTNTTWYVLYISGCHLRIRITFVIEVSTHDYYVKLRKSGKPKLSYENVYLPILTIHIRDVRAIYIQ